jgi:hypothetical protein
MMLLTTVTYVLLAVAPKSDPGWRFLMDPLHVPPRPWHTFGLDFITHLLASEGFDSSLVVIDHLTRMASLLQQRLQLKKRLN